MIASTERQVVKIKVNEISLEYMLATDAIAVLQALVQQHGPEVDIGSVLYDGIAYEIRISRLEEDWEMKQRIKQRADHLQRQEEHERKLYAELKAKFDPE